MSVAVLLVGLGPLGPSPAVAEQTVGLFVNETPQEGLTLFNPAASNTSYLLSNDGLLVHSWNTPFRPGAMGYLLENGHLLRAARLSVVDSRWIAVAAAGGRVEEYDWENNRLWEFEYSAAEHLTHHDMEPLPNGNVLLVAWEVVTEAEAIAEGKSPVLVDTELWIDHVIEVRRTPPFGGEIVWEWHARDHLIQDIDPTKGNFGPVEDHPELIDFNFGGPGTDWTHVNGIDYNAEFDQIVLSVHALDEIWIIDHSTTTAEAAGHTGGTYGKGGDLLYRWGNPQIYRGGSASDQQLFHQHDSQWIEEGRPGAGNIIVFNNGQNRPGGDYSSVEEIVPPVDPNGFYASPAPGGAFGPETPIWSYVASPPLSFYQPARSGAERQPNGNTLICAAAQGRAFEVEPDGDLMWEYINPLGPGGFATQGGNTGNNGVFKVRRYPLDFPGFAGRDLTPGDPLETFSPPYPVPDDFLRVDKVIADGTTLDVEWNAFSCPSSDYNLIYGPLQEVATYEISGAECGVGLSGGFLWSGVPGSDLFFLIVGTDILDIYESSWGRDSDGGERYGTKASFQCGTTTKVVSSTCP